MIEQINPMSCKGSSKLLKDALTSNEWIAEEKLDGIRFLMHITEDSIRFTSRGLSKETGLFVERTGNFPHLEKLDIKDLAYTVIDGEMKHKRWNESQSITGSDPENALKVQNEIGYIDYYAFDVIRYKNENVENKPFNERKLLLKSILERINSQYIKIVNFVEGNKKQEYFNTLVKNGGEGIILKRLDSTYQKNDWIKMKKEMTVDCIILDFEKPSEWYAKPGTTGSDGIFYPDGKHTKFYDNNWMGKIVLGLIHNGKLVEVARCSGINDKQREEFSLNKEKYICKVIEVEAQEFTVTYSLRNPRFLRLRDDKPIEECLLQKELEREGIILDENKVRYYKKEIRS